jgi:hypothetical protein
MTGSVFDCVIYLQANGTAKPCIASLHLQAMEEDGTWSPYKEMVLSNTLATMYGGMYTACPSRLS